MFFHTGTPARSRGSVGHIPASNSRERPRPRPARNPGHTRPGATVEPRPIECQDTRAGIHGIPPTGKLRLPHGTHPPQQKLSTRRDAWQRRFIPARWRGAEAAGRLAPCAACAGAGGAGRVGLRSFTDDPREVGVGRRRNERQVSDSAAPRCLLRPVDPPSIAFRLLAASCGMPGRPSGDVLATLIRGTLSGDRSFRLNNFDAVREIEYHERGQTHEARVVPCRASRKPRGH
jgi:hypothetical protein